MKYKTGILSNSGNSTPPPPLRKLVNHLRSMLSPEQIFAVRHPGSEYTALLLVIPDNEPGRCINPEATVQRMHSYHPQVHISLHKASVMRRRLAQGHAYYSRVCTPAYLIYSSGAAALPVTPAKKLAAAQAAAKLVFYNHTIVAGGFMQCARHCLSGKNYVLTLFMLHQCAELTLRAAIMAITGQETMLHSLPELLQDTYRFAPALQQLFTVNNAGDNHLLHLLNSACTQARHNASFTVSAANAKALMKKVQRLEQLVNRLFAKPKQPA